MSVLNQTETGREPPPLVPIMPPPGERLAAGKARRRQVPRSSHRRWKPASDRPDPLALLEKSNQSRLPELAPIRYGRMLESPFTFLRGSPVVMASDLAGTPITNFRAQICGDAHLRNFGVYASPERNLLFDINDFDETLAGPWEWDLKRLAASFFVAARCNGFHDVEAAEAVRTCSRSYRRRMLEFSQMGILEVWFSRVNADAALQIFHRSGRQNWARTLQKARQRNTLQVLPKITTLVDGRLQLVEHPPILTHVRNEERAKMLRELFRGYRASLQEDRRHLLERYRFLDFALKVVGVGSVGTRCYVLLLDSNHQNDPLLLQVKEAQESVLEPHLGPGPYKNHGRRVVCGQRLMQAASDIFLGWACLDGHDCYFRILRDMKGAAEIEKMSPDDLCDYAELCGWVLARAHARSGDPCLIAGYLGKGEVFDDALAKFARAYADQTERDYHALAAAVQAGRVHAETGL